MADSLFGGLPPPSQQKERQEEQAQQHQCLETPATGCGSSPSPIPPPKPVLKSALKRSEPTESNSEDSVPEKRLRFKTTTDASETQIIEAMQRIASHIKNPAKFSKASKLAIQLIQTGSVKPGTSDHFFAILEAAMSSSTSCTDPSVRTDYHTLFLAAQDARECLNKKQKNQFTTWMIWAVDANELYTDDSFVFSKTAGRVKEAICNLPVATEDDDIDEAAALKDASELTDGNGQTKQEMTVVDPSEQEEEKKESDPFGLDAFMTSSVGKGEKMKGKKDGIKEEEEEELEKKRCIKSQREALITCLEIAARRYKIPWCQTVIDILVKHAYDNVARFTSRQRDAIEKLWASIREQHNRRKQGKSVTGKLDVNAFEWLQQKYSSEKISIRHSVGGSGDRRAQQWLG